MVAPLDNLIRSLSKLPGLGRRSAERAALALLRNPDLLLDTLLRYKMHARMFVVVRFVVGLHR